LWHRLDLDFVFDDFEHRTAVKPTQGSVLIWLTDAHIPAARRSVADAGMMSEANLADIEGAGWSFVIGGRLPEVPYPISQWRRDNPDMEPADGMTLTQPTVMGAKADQRRRTTIYQ
jgi:hypothetical protein